jgi:hypothetical protein
MSLSSGADATVTSLGADLAWRHEFGRGSEFRIGAGARWIQASGAGQMGDGAAYPVFAALQTGGVVDERTGLRVRLGLEVRATYAPSIEVSGAGSLEQAWFTAGFYVGLELPLGKAPASAAAASGPSDASAKSP